MAGDAGLEKLLADYTRAVTQERAAWRRLNAIPLGDARRDAATAEWMAAAERTKRLADELKAGTSKAPPSGED